MTNAADGASKLDHPHENPSRIVWALAWPAVALNSLQVINTLLDRGFIGHLPSAALTAHGGSINVLFLMFSLAMALGTAATALVSRAFGAGEVNTYRMASKQSFSISIFVGVALGGVTALIAPWAAHLILPAEDRAAMDLMTRFVQVYSIGLPAIYVIQALAGSLRGVGDTKSPMFISGIQILLHIVLNFLLIFPTREVGGVTIPGAGLGLIGAGLALALSAWASAIVYVLYTPRTELGLVWDVRLPEIDWVRRILRVAVPAAVMSVLRVFSLTAFTLVLKNVPNASAAIAAMGVAFAIEGIMFMPSFGLSTAAAALVGQSLGMKRPDRAERLGWLAGHYSALVTLLLAGPIFFAAPQIATLLLGSKPEIIRETTEFLRMLCVTEVFFAYSMVMMGAMQGAGDTVRPMWISVIAMWGLRVPMAFLLALPIGLSLGARGAWISMSLTQAIQGIMSLIVFKQGAWKTKEV
ncbi:MAG TPA: MATE family efflux transporter [Fimbriimonadaceae bacterium]|nr:MATE family efflux transporter [Fimbriimonadaceae bacterium]